MILLKFFFFFKKSKHYTQNALLSIFCVTSTVTRKDFFFSFAYFSACSIDTKIYIDIDMNNNIKRFLY